MNYCKLVTTPKIFKKFSTVRPSAIPDNNVINDINNNVYKFRKHPGVVTPRTILIPETFIKAVINVLADYPLKALVESSEQFSRHLTARVAPMEKSELREKVKNIQQKILSGHSNVVFNNHEEEMNFRQMIEHKIQRKVNEKIYNWKPVKYNGHNCLLYLIARSAAEYSVLVKIFSEIAARDPDFKPKSLFDYGSGVGTATWATNIYWKKYIFEYFNVDASREMNDLAQILLQGGSGTGTMPIKGVFYRQFLPATALTYDLVVSAYSMFELPSLQSRLETATNLWNKTAKYLILVEQGTNAGFKVLNEIRDFLLQVNTGAHKCTVFSPCPHDDTCPRFLLDDGTPCNFEVAYHSLPLSSHSIVKRELYSYIVLKKCKAGEDNTVEERWPRLVRPTLVKSKHTICRMCTNSGKLQEVILTASKYGKTMYHCARSTKWGDRLPVTIKEHEEKPCDTKEQIENKILF